MSMATLDGLQQPFRTHVEQLLAAAGGRVTLESGFRTYQQQLELRHTNGCPDPLHSPPEACAIPTAIPGTSQHERGLAVDFGGDLGLVAQLSPKFLMHRTVPGEAWHYEPTDPQEPDDMYDTTARNEVVSRLDQIIWLLKQALGPAIQDIEASEHRELQDLEHPTPPAPPA